MVAQSTRAVDGGRIPGSSAVPNVIQVKMIFTLANGKQATTSCYGVHEGTVIASSALANQLFGLFSGSWTTRLATYLNALVTFTALSVRDMSNPTSAEFRSSSPAVPSGGSGDALPQDVALVLTAEAITRGRGAKGRMFIPGWSEIANGANGQAVPGAVTALTQWGTDIRTHLNSVALTSCVAKPHRQEYIGLTGAHHDDRPATNTQVTAYICQNGEWDTQRRRGL